MARWNITKNLAEAANWLRGFIKQCPLTVCSVLITLSKTKMIKNKNLLPLKRSTLPVRNFRHYSRLFPEFKSAELP